MLVSVLFMLSTESFLPMSCLHRLKQLKQMFQLSQHRMLRQMMLRQLKRMSQPRKSPRRRKQRLSRQTRRRKTPRRPRRRLPLLNQSVPTVPHVHVILVPMTHGPLRREGSERHRRSDRCSCQNTKMSKYVQNT